jgi:hypothetical protein
MPTGQPCLVTGYQKQLIILTWWIYSEFACHVECQVYGILDINVDPIIGLHQNSPYITVDFGPETTQVMA